MAERLQQSLMLAESDEIVTRGGVYALVGPTGAGKTTTVAKIAARAVVRFGASKVALLTTDSYRVGAHEQLRIYGRILDVPVHIVRDQSDLSETLAELLGRHLVLIDTIGMSQRDAWSAQHAAMLAGSGDVKRLLLLQATSSARTLEEVVTRDETHGLEAASSPRTDEAAGSHGCARRNRATCAASSLRDGRTAASRKTCVCRIAPTLVREAVKPPLLTPSASRRRIFRC